MLKNKIRYWCQQLIGLDRYLFLFARLTIFRIRYLGYEKEFRCFMRLLPPRGIVLDIGANIGVMSAVLALKFPRSEVVAFEPVPLTADVLRKVTAHFGLTNVQIFQTALGETEGEITMLTPLEDKAVMHGLSHVWQKPERTAPADVFTVPITTLDQLPLLQKGGKITAIKIDVENFEYYVLKGGRQLLQKHHPMVFAELWNDARKTQCITLMEELGYTVKICHKGALADYRGEDVLNYFFLHL
ncbi:MAG: FkbM family methyltransferase [Chitinophagaceae bacterium]|nr:MAG: FkbM family methyltransferase [Chitinophagaceae bacterium]